MTTLKHQSMQENDQYVEKPIGEQGPISLRRYLPWVMEQHDKEHVSFASFVEKFKLSDLTDALETYEALINSTNLKTWRQQSLSTAYRTFKNHSLQGFWSNRMLEIERRGTKTNFDIVATKTARIVQNASLDETLRAAGVLGSDSNDQYELECSVRSKRKMQQGGSFKEHKRKARAADETSTNTELIDGAATISSHQEATVSSDGGAGDAGPATEPRPHFDLDSTRRITLTVAGFDVGAAFRRLQEEAAPFINNEGLKVSIKKLHLMLSANSIWDTSERLPGMPSDTHRNILSEIKPAVVRLSAEKSRLFLDFSYELAATGRVRSRALETEEEEDLLQLFQDFSKKLPPVAHPSVELFDLAFAEIKAPKDDRSTRLYIQDKWALASLAKDTIDLHLRTGYLPRDKNDTHCLIRCIELLNTVKSLMDDIPVLQYVHTPPKRDPDYLLPEELRPQPTNITPSSRPFFGGIVKGSPDAPK
ncbi:hypothetical protein EC957_011065 [Mortierella hygrophila]|uniref:Uncharacterized protein n=1 Tax=Mortierella hygrophila TaxID=979708 RepID=A0A9P6FA25_9FUNG|nr:hypothetical protein EC957_011065 [Mortierella hygrophila]